MFKTLFNFHCKVGLVLLAFHCLCSSKLGLILKKDTLYPKTNVDTPVIKFQHSDKQLGVNNFVKTQKGNTISYATIE